MKLGLTTRIEGSATSSTRMRYPVPIGGAVKLVLACPLTTATVRAGGMTTSSRSRSVNTTWLIGPVTLAAAGMVAPATTMAAKGARTIVLTTAAATCATEKPCATLRAVAKGPTAPSSVTPVPKTAPGRTGSRAKEFEACSSSRSPGCSRSATAAKYPAAVATARVSVVR